MAKINADEYFLCVGYNKILHANSHNALLESLPQHTSHPLLALPLDCLKIIGYTK